MRSGTVILGSHGALVPSSGVDSKVVRTYPKGRGRGSVPLPSRAACQTMITAHPSPMRFALERREAVVRQNHRARNITDVMAYRCSRVSGRRRNGRVVAGSWSVTPRTGVRDAGRGPATAIALTSRREVGGGLHSDNIQPWRRDRCWKAYLVVVAVIDRRRAGEVVVVGKREEIVIHGAGRWGRENGGRLVGAEELYAEDG